MRTRFFVAGLLALPGVVLAGAGATHPRHLTAETAPYWWQMHVVALFVFPLLGLSLWALVRGRRDPLALAVALLAYVYATCYTALDVLSGIGAGYVMDRDAGATQPPAAHALFAVGGPLGDYGAWALLAAAVLVAADRVRRLGVLAVAPSLVLLVACWSYLDSHIFWWRGVLTVLAIGVSTAWLEALRRTPAPPSRAP